MENFKNILCIFIVGIITILLNGCATVRKDKIETIAQYKEEVKKEYALPKLSSCENIPSWNDGTFESLYKWGVDIKKIFKDCNQYNEEKKDWIERNFKK